MSHTDEGTTEPTVSVVVPVYNDPRGIRMTLEAVAEQTYPDDAYEVLAVDNGSSDGTREVIRAFAAAYDNVHLLLEDEVQGSYAARNEGIRQSRGELVAFVDADVTVPETWIEAVVGSYEKHGWDYMGCRIETYVDGPETLGARYDRLLGGFPVEHYLEGRQFAVTACLVVRKAVFDAVGPFDERYTSHGDVEFGQRIHEAGFEQRFEPGITVYHPARSTLRAWLRKQVRIGRGAVQHRAFAPERAGDDGRSFALRRVLPPRPWGFYGRLTDATEPTPREAVELYAVDYLSKLARTGGAIRERIDRRRAGYGP